MKVLFLTKLIVPDFSGVQVFTRNLSKRSPSELHVTAPRLSHRPLAGPHLPQCCRARPPSPWDRGALTWDGEVGHRGAGQRKDGVHSEGGGCAAGHKAWRGCHLEVRNENMQKHLKMKT